jgi:Phage integrase family
MARCTSLLRWLEPPHAATAWGWPSVFPARHRSVAPRSGITRRHHVAPSVLHKAIKGAVRRAGLTKTVSAHTCRRASAIHLLPRGPDTPTFRHLLGHSDLATTMLYTHILQQGGQGVPSPLGDLDVWLSCLVCLTPIRVPNGSGQHCRALPAPPRSTACLTCAGFTPWRWQRNRPGSAVGSHERCGATQNHLQLCSMRPTAQPRGRSCRGSGSIQAVQGSPPMAWSTSP